MNFYKPQLARPFDEKRDEHLWDNPRFWVEEKLDGHRVRVQQGLCLSRTGKENGIRFTGPAGAKAVLDGELVVRPELGIPTGHADVGHWLSEDPTKLKLVVFDLPIDPKDETIAIQVRQMVLKDRRRFLEAGMTKAFGEGCRGEWKAEWKGKEISLQVELNRPVNGDRRKFYDDLIRRDGEGVVFKDSLAPYAPGSRSAWIKKKAYDNVDAVMTDCAGKPTEWRVKPGDVDKQTGLVCPEGDHSEPWKLGYVVLSYGFYDKAGTLRTVGTTGFSGPPAEMAKHVGRVAEFKSWCPGGHLPETGAIQHPTFVDWRDDKDPKECVWEGFVL